MATEEDGGETVTSNQSITSDHCFGTRSTSLCFHRNLFWQLSRDGDLHGSGMSHATTASPKPSFRAPWRVGDAVVGRRNAGWTTSKSGPPCLGQNCSQGPPAENIGVEGGFRKDTDIVERTSKAEVRPEERCETAESCRENLWNEIQLKGS